MQPISLDPGHYWVLFRQDPAPIVARFAGPFHPENGGRIYWPWQVIGKDCLLHWDDITLVLDVIRPPLGVGQAVTIHWLRPENFRIDSRPHTAQSEDNALQIISEVIGAPVHTGGWTNYVNSGIAYCNVYSDNEKPPVVIPEPRGYNHWEPAPVARLSCPIAKDLGNLRPLPLRIQAEKLQTSEREPD